LTLAAELGYAVPEPNAFQHAMWSITSSRPGAWIFARVAPRIDKMMLRRTGGRVTVARLFAGIPVLTLVSTGAKSGLRRQTPLLGIPTADGIALIGTQFGQPGLPAWYHNLTVNPRAELVFSGVTVATRAREANAEEQAAIWAAARKIYGGYEAYARRIHDRKIPMMILESDS
jgi:deazaflavin-dependent oxidoreductase (nitroreductase family)